MQEQNNAQSMTRREVTLTEYNQAFNKLFPIFLSPKHLLTGYSTEISWPYKITREDAFAMPLLQTHTAKTAVLPVYYQERCSFYIEDYGWIDLWNVYYQQPMQVFTSSYEAIVNPTAHEGCVDYIGEIL